MTWADLFERAASYDVTVDDVRESLEARRDDAREGDSTEDEGDDDR